MSIKDTALPIFTENESLEFRIEDDEVIIYANKTGLEKLKGLCDSLLASAENKHIHIEDYQFCTKKTKNAVMAVFIDKANSK